MPDPEAVTLAVISDLHCRLSTDANDSFLTVGGLRSPSSRHPVQALVDLIASERLHADALLVPGDLANRACVECLGQGWDYALEMGRQLGVSKVIPVVGNHDVDSQRVHPDVPVFHAVQNLRPGFPFPDPSDVSSFFADGYCVLEVANAEIIAVNTVIDHTDAASAKRGSFGIDRIVRMERSLSGRLARPLRVALMHHHPMLHSGTFLSDLDVIPTGDALLAALRRLGCGFVVHGHKHFTRLSYVDGMAVFASGSFSALLREFATSVSNTFHIVHVRSDGPYRVRGVVRTWVFRYGWGWRRSNAEHAGFPYSSGFGCKLPLADAIAQLEALAGTDQARNRFFEHEVFSAVPEAEYLTPSEREQVNVSLRPLNLKISDSDDGQLELLRLYKP